MKRFCILLACAIVLVAAGCSDNSTKMLGETLKTLNDNGVAYSGSLSGPIQGGFELYQGGRLTTGGILTLELRSPVVNPGPLSDNHE